MPKDGLCEGESEGERGAECQCAHFTDWIWMPFKEDERPEEGLQAESDSGAAVPYACSNTFGIRKSCHLDIQEWMEAT